VEGTAPSLVGRVLGDRYAVESVLAHGAMGVIYRARQTRIGRPVAIKVLRHRWCDDPRLVRRFDLEARIGSLLHHPNLLTIHDRGETGGGRPYLVTELLTGQTARQLLKEQGRLGEEAALDIVRQVAEGLAAVHACGVVHRDVKPDNLFLMPDRRVGRRVKLLDFGFATRAGSGEEERLTAAGRTVGTPGYMPPEQFTARPVDARSDLYALGCVAFHLLTGELPFTGRSIHHVALAHCRRTARRPSSLADVSTAADRLVLRLLSKDPGGRPASAEALLDELERLSGSQPRLPAWPLKGGWWRRPAAARVGAA